VNCFPTDEWPYDTTCVAVDVYDERVSFDYPTTIEVRASDEQATLLTRHIVFKDSSICLRFYPTGQLKVKDVSNRGGSLAWLLNETYHPNGQLRAKWNVSTDTLELLTTYYANGQREREYWYYAARAFNDWTEWYENGQVKLEAHYEQGPLTEEMKPFRESLAIGEWRYYKANGDLEKVEVYEDGKLKETRTK
jgi:antitoxin component YwqK of YwqJK toxin-antitoxin module